MRAPDVWVASQADSATGHWTVNHLHFLTNAVPPLQLRAWTTPLTRTVVWDLLCTTRSQAQSSPECSRPCTAPQRLGLRASLGTLLHPLAATEAWQQTLRLPSCGLSPPSSVAPTQNTSRRVTRSRKSCTELGDAEAQHAPLASAACQIRHLHQL